MEYEASLKVGKVSCESMETTKLVPQRITVKSFEVS